MSTEMTRGLISSIATGNYSDEELAAFLEAVKTMDKASFIAAYQLLYEEVNKHPAEELTPGFKEQLEKRLDLLEAEKNFLPGNLVSGKPQQGVLSFGRNWWRYAAAIVVFLVIVGGITGGYFAWRGHPGKNGPIAVVKKVIQDVAPGRNKAVLTLAGGQKIVLDSATGAISKQGNTTVVNTNGRLAYNALHGKPAEVLYNTLATERGNQYQLVLPDGSKVWLNASSSITYPTVFAGGERKIAVTGKAYFEIATDKNKPFRIAINGKEEVEVLGTQFNINAYADEPSINTTLLEGSVKVNTREKGRTESLLLQPGQQGQLNMENHLSRVDNVDVDEVVAWKNGSFQFKGASTQTVMRQLSRWYDVEVVYEGAIPERRFVGKVGREYNLSEVLAVLGASDVHFKIEGQRIIVRP